MRFQYLLANTLGYVLLALVSMSARATDAPVILVVGDSLSAAYGMEMAQSWPTLLQNRLQDNGQNYRVVNASITGETTQGGITRLPGLLERLQPAWVIVELGGNDGLRGFSLEVTRQNLSDMVQMSKASGAQVLLTGIMLPPNYGRSYTEAFQALYPDVAGEHDALLLPFFMQGVALVEGMMQDDGIHPSAQAQPVLLNNVWSVLEPALAAPPAGQAAAVNAAGID